MKTPAQSIVHALYRVPLVGRLARIAVGLARLPELRREVDVMREALTSLRALEQRLDGLQASVDTMGGQLAAIMSDHDNLMKSVPVALRQTARDLESLRARIDSGCGPASATVAPQEAT